MTQKRNRKTLRMNMTKFHQSLRIGIRNKLSLLFLLSAIVPFMIIGYYGYMTASRSLIDNVLSTDRSDVDNDVAQIQNYLNTINSDLDFLVNFYPLHQFLQWQSLHEPYKTAIWLEETQDAFYSFLTAKQYLMKLQVIDSYGYELLRITYEPQQSISTIASESELQNRKNYNYFKEAIKLSDNEIYVASFHINEEQLGNFSKMPVISYATPLIDQNHIKHGILVVSVDAGILLRILKNRNDQSHHYILINQKGKHLYHSDDDFQNSNPQESWYMMHEISLENEAPALFAAITENQQGRFSQDGIISTFKRLYPVPDAAEDYWVLVKQTQKTIVFAKVEEFKHVFIGTIIGVIIIVLILANWLTRKLVNPLLQVNNHLKTLAQGEWLDNEIKYRANDEIKEIIISSKQLKNAIKATIEQTQAIAAGNYDNEVKLLSQQDRLGQALVNMTHTLREVTAQNAKGNWLKNGQTQLNDRIRGEQDIVSLAKNIITFLTTYLGAQVGLFYLLKESEPNTQKPSLQIIASYAYSGDENRPHEFSIGEGLIGEAALQRKMIIRTPIPEEYTPIIQSGLLKAVPRHVVVIPFLYENAVKGIIELGTTETFTEIQREFLEQAMLNIGIAINTAESRTQMQALLQQSQRQAEELQNKTAELQSQREQLQHTNEELQNQAEELQSQQEELRQTNEELEERTRALERQKEQIRDKNLILEQTQQAIETKAQELELASKYKSEFLANMSHELRTPLNSLLILAQLLADNKNGNLNDKQVEYAQTIHSAGSDLLTLINDILDLSKVEAGKMELHIEEVSLLDLIQSIEQKFHPLAQKKGLAFDRSVADGVPPMLRTDAQRLKQIINNLLSNAFKFTSQGGIKLIVREITDEELKTNQKLSSLEVFFAISVVDTGIGIPRDRQQIIFEAFQQVDGTTSRRYGGTGLGLSISRQFARLLGGELQLHSEEGQGSTFTLYLPKTPPKDSQKNTGNSIFSTSAVPKNEPLKITTGLTTDKTSPTTPATTTQLPEIADDRNGLQPSDKSILIIEDDRKFSQILLDLAREQGFKVLIAEDGKTGLQLAEEYHPHSIILDVGLPQIDGWTVMEKLKDNPQTRHIPVHFMSASDQSLEAKKMGAIGYLLKPVSMVELGAAFKKIEGFINKNLKNILIIVDNEPRQQEIMALVGNEEVKSTVAATLTEAYRYLHNRVPFDCIILDVDIEQQSGLQFLEQLQKEDQQSQVPVIIYAERELTLSEEKKLPQYAENLTIKAVRSPERLLDEATLFLHQVEASLPAEKQQMLQMVHDKEAILSGKKVLLVDDDVRNTFALLTVLEDKNMEVITGNTGKEALELLAQHDDIAIILMDVMMPEMDGYEAMREIRKQSRHRKLPIIALTAKAMKGDKVKCIEAGANDYLTKPVDTEKLISLMRVWLYR